MVLDASLLSTQHYKVRIKGKVEQSRKGVAPSPTHWCSSYRKGSLRFTLDYGRQLYLYIDIHGALNKIPDFFCTASKIVVDSWKFNILLLYILWDGWLIFMISASNELLQQQLEYTLLKPDCHSWWISKMQFGREDALEEWYAIKFYFKLGKNATETYGMFQTAFLSSCMNRASVFVLHKRFKEGRESVRDDERCRKSKEVNTPELIGQRVRVRVTMLRCKGVLEEIPSGEASTFQIGSVAFPPGQCTSPQLHHCHRLFEQDGHRDSSSPSLLSRPCSLWLLVIPLAQRLPLWDNWRDERGYDEGHWHVHTRGLPWGLQEVVGICALQLEEIILKGTRVSYVYSQ